MSDDIFKQMGKRAFGGAAAKRPAASASVASPAPKKPADQQNGTFQCQKLSTRQQLPAASPSPAALPSADAPPSPADSTAPPPEKSLRVPPFFIDQTTDWPVLAEKLKALIDGDFTAIARGRHIRLQTSTVDDFRAIQRYLVSGKVAFHTFNLGGRQTIKVVVSGLPSTVETGGVIRALQNEGFPVEDASRLRARVGRSNRWLVTLAQYSARGLGQHRASNIYRLTELFSVRVTVESYKRPSGPPQCHNCQGFGHGSLHCGRPVRCVRCGEAHNVLKCQRQPTMRGTCVNCGGDHNANWRGCKAFAEAKSASAPRPLKRVVKARRLPKPPAQPTIQPDTEPTTEESAVEDVTGTTRKRKKRRQPRNPLNRRPRSEDYAAPAREPSPSPTPQQAASARPPRPPPRQPPGRPPTPATTQSAPLTAAIPAESEVLTAIAAIAHQLTELIKLISKLVDKVN